MNHDKTKVFAAYAALVFIIDQIVKYAVAKANLNLVIIKDFFSMTYTTNTGAAFGILIGQRLLLIFFSIIILAAVVYCYRKTPLKVVPFCAALFGGALGNLADRLFRGYVIDFISIGSWPAFNVADIAISVGVIGIFFWTISKSK